MTHHAKRIRNAAAIMTALDVGAMVDYYTGVLGFELDHTYGAPPEHASIKAGATSFHFTASPTAASRSRDYVTVYVDDIAPIHADLEQRGVAISLTPVTAPWGAEVFMIRDPEGCQLMYAAVHDTEDHHGT